MSGESNKLIELLREQHGEAVIGSYVSGGDASVLIGRDKLIEVMQFLRDDPRCLMNMLVMVTAVDYLDYPTQLRPACSPADEGNAYGFNAYDMPRYEVVYALLSMPLRQRLRVKVPLTADDPHVPTLCDLYKAANWGEREAWDMLGVVFDGHPDLRRMLMYEEFEGHPLRRDYDLRGYQPLVDMPHLADYKDNARDR